MHYTGTIWRPPYEAESLLLEVTAGCTHHKCKFCTLYEDLPFAFRLSPMKDIESDLLEVQMSLYDPVSEMKRRLNGLTSPKKIRRVFLTGANPFVLSFEKLMDIAELVHLYFPENETIGCFARVTDAALKSDEELSALRKAGYDGLTIGIETGDDEALRFMNKGYCAADIVAQCRRLDAAGIGYSFFYLAGISGSGRGEAGARLTAEVCNRLHPRLIGANMLTVYPESELHREIADGAWTEESETEKYTEIRTLIEELTVPLEFAAMGASNAFKLYGVLPRDKAGLLAAVDAIIQEAGEETLRRYRTHLRHL